MTKIKILDDGYDTIQNRKQRCIDFIKYMISLGENDCQLYSCVSHHYISVYSYKSTPTKLRTYFECDLCGCEEETLEDFLDYDTLEQYQNITLTNVSEDDFISGWEVITNKHTGDD